MRLRVRKVLHGTISRPPCERAVYTIAHIGNGEDNRFGWQHEDGHECLMSQSHLLFDDVL